MAGTRRARERGAMKKLDKPIPVREEFFYEVLLPYLYPNLGDKGWDIDVSTPSDSPYVELRGLQDPDGESYTAARAERLMLKLHKKAKLAPFYVYGYHGTHHQRTDGGWHVKPATDMECAVKIAQSMRGSPEITTVWIYKDAEMIDKLFLTGRVVYIRPFKIRFVQIEDYRDVALFEADFADWADALRGLEALHKEMTGAGAVYARIRIYGREVGL